MITETTGFTADSDARIEQPVGAPAVTAGGSLRRLVIDSVGDRGSGRCIDVAPHAQVAYEPSLGEGRGHCESGWAVREDNHVRPGGPAHDVPLHQLAPFVYLPS